MTAATVCRIVASGLVLLISAALAMGGIQLWRGGAEAWPDIIANETTVRRTSAGLVVMATILLVAGIAAICNLPWGARAAAIATLVLVGLAFWANYALFGDIRPLHTGTNIIVAAIIVGLLWFASGPQSVR
jgi:hypothetical protein